LIIVVAYAAFVSLGLPDGLLGVAWPSIRATFRLPIDSLGSLLMMFTIGYLVSSFLSGRLLSLMSLGSLLALSCAATALSLIGYAIAPAWLMIVALGIVAGVGAGAIDAGLNTFAAMRFSGRMVNWLHACYGVGAATGPAIMTSVLAAGRPWQRGYWIVGGWQLALAFSFLATRRWWPAAAARAGDSPARITRTSNVTTLRLPAVWVSIAVFFVYTGIEAAAGIWAYSVFTESRAVSTTTAGAWVSIYWGALTAGRLLSGLVADFIPSHKMVRFCIIGMALGAALIWSNVTTQLGFLGLGLMGLASAPVFPSLIAATPARFGSAHTGNVVGFQIAAAVLGQSLLPALIGLFARRLGLEIVGASLFASALVLLAFYELLTSIGAVALRQATPAG
jgi:fucose permease